MKMNKNKASLGSSIVIIALCVATVLLTRLANQQSPEPTSDSESLTLPLIMGDQSCQTIYHQAYTIGYSPDWCIPLWVSYVLTGEETRGSAERSQQFEPDPMVEKAVLHTDYSNNPGRYDRGHMAPAADFKFDDQASRESFYTSNICPQNHELNKGDWNNLEMQVRQWAVRYDSVYVVSGPIVPQALYSGASVSQVETIGWKHTIVVPEAFYKVVLRCEQDEWHAIAFVMPNRAGSQPLMSYLTTIDAIEEMAHIDLFAALPDSIEDRIESQMDATNWALKK